MASRRWTVLSVILFHTHWPGLKTRGCALLEVIKMDVHEDIAKSNPVSSINYL